METAASLLSQVLAKTVIEGSGVDVVSELIEAQVLRKAQVEW